MRFRDLARPELSTCKSHTLLQSRFVYGILDGRGLPHGGPSQGMSGSDCKQHWARRAQVAVPHRPCHKLDQLYFFRPIQLILQFRSILVRLNRFRDGADILKPSCKNPCTQIRPQRRLPRSGLPWSAADSPPPRCAKSSRYPGPTRKCHRRLAHR